jgi:O-antigen ligase
MDPNFAGIFFSIFTVYVFGFLIEEKERTKKLFYSTLALLSFTAVVLTYSRSALICLVISIFIFLALHKKAKYALLFLLFLVLAVCFSPKVFQTEGTNLFRSVSTYERIKSAGIAAEVFKRNPIFGVGFDAYRYAQYKYGYISGSKWMTSHSGSGADNSYLFLLATTGIIGFAIYALFLRQIYLGVLNKKKENAKNNRWTVVCVSSLSGVLVSAFFINSLFYPPIMLWLWILIGITESN